MKITAFAASNSRTSINKSLVQYAAKFLKVADVNLLDLNDFELPVFSEKLEEEIGQPPQAHDFLANIAASDGVLVSFAEHNGNYSATYKNTFDWASRINPKVYQKKPVTIMSTSPGGRGGKGVLSIASSQLPFFDAEVISSFSLPNFYENFDLDKLCITESSLDEELQVVMMDFEKRIKMAI